MSEEGYTDLGNSGIEEEGGVGFGGIFYGEDVEIRIFITRIGNSSFTVEQEAWQKGKLRTKGQTVIVHHDYLTEKTIPIPESIKELLAEHMEVSDKVSDV